MSTADRFDRYVESLLDDLAGPSIPGYIGDALATATARPQRRLSILGRPLGGSLASKQPMLRTAMIGLPVVFALTIGLLGVLVIGGYVETPSPSPLLTPQESAKPTSTPSIPIGPAPSPLATTGVVETCPGYADAADARVIEGAGDVAWLSEDTPLPGPSNDGRVAAFAPDLPGGGAVVLIDPADGRACRLIDLEGNEEVLQFAFTSPGDALAISTGRRVLVLSSAGLTQVDRVGGGRPAGTSIAWSPAGDAIAINNLGGPLILAFADGSKRELSIDGAQGFAWSPDGRRLHAAFAAHVGGAIVHTLSTDRGPLDPIDIGSPIERGESVAGWLDNDTLIVGGSGATGGYDAYDVPSGTRQPWSDASIETFGLMYVIGYAPGLTGVALFANANTDAQATPQDLIVQDLPSGEIDVLGTRLFPPFNAVGGGAWSPDGTRIAVSLEGAEDDPRLVPGLWLYSVDGSEPIHLVSEFQVRVSAGAWQPMP